MSLPSSEIYADACLKTGAIRERRNAMLGNDTLSLETFARTNNQCSYDAKYFQENNDLSSTDELNTVRSPIIRLFQVTAKCFER